MAETPLIPDDAETRSLSVPSRGRIGLVVRDSIDSGLVAGLVQGRRGGWREVGAHGGRRRRRGFSSVIDRQASRGVQT
jgi:hypothetical protein